MDNSTRIATIINNGMSSLGRKIDSLAMELRRRTPPPNTKVSVDIGDNVAKGVSDAIKESITGLEMPKFEGFPEYPAFPEIPTPQVTVNVPDIKLPTINIPETIVNIPEAQITVQPTPVTFPSEMKVIGMDQLIAEVSKEDEEKSIFEEVSSKKPLCVQIIDSKGKQVSSFGGDFTAPSTVAIRVGTTAVSNDNLMPVTTDGFAIPIFDTQVIDEALAPATTVITYKRGGVTVATKTIEIDGSITTISVV